MALAPAPGKTLTTRLVLAAMAGHRLAPGDLSASQRAALREHKDSGIRAEAIQLLGPAPADRTEAIARFLPAMRLAGLSVAVGDAVAAVKGEAGYILSAAGGRGAVRELADLVLSALATR